MTTYSSILAWRIPGTEEPGGLQSIGLQRVRQIWVTVHVHTPSMCITATRLTMPSVHMKSLGINLFQAQFCAHCLQIIFAKLRYSLAWPHKLHVYVLFLWLDYKATEDKNHFIPFKNPDVCEHGWLQNKYNDQ